jgi:recombinational DNA repair protein RecR
MKKLMLIAALALAGCNEEGRKRELDAINTKLPDGCVMSDMGNYDNIYHVLVVVCEGAKTISTNTSWTQRVGKITTTKGGVTVQIEEH